MFEAGGVTLVDSTELLDQFKDLAEEQTILAFDAEGVSLSRLGELTLMSFGVEVSGGVHVFLLDPIDAVLKQGVHEVAEVLLESRNILKIIHDCRQDSDALSAQFQPPITLCNVFDTQIWDSKLSGALESRRGLNEVLRSCGLPANLHRVGQDYNARPDYWKRRPITQEMINYASGDIFHLFKLRVKLIEKAGSSTKFEAESMAAPDFLRSMKFHATVDVPASARGRVIGSGGSNIKVIERSTKTSIWGRNSGFLVIAATKTDLDKAVMSIKSKASFSPRVLYSYEYDSDGYGSD
jgi:3'-5' exonuclease/KH domain